MKLLRPELARNDAYRRRFEHEVRAAGEVGHPGLVPILNAAFSATPEEIERARSLVAAFEAARAAGQGAFVFDGKMVDEPVVARARVLLARAGREPRE